MYLILNFAERSVKVCFTLARSIAGGCFDGVCIVSLKLILFISFYLTTMDALGNDSCLFKVDIVILQYELLWLECFYHIVPKALISEPGY